MTSTGRRNVENESAAQIQRDRREKGTYINTHNLLKEQQDAQSIAVDTV